MSKKILTSIDPSNITINFFSRIYNIIKSSIHIIITPPKPGNEEAVVIPSSDNDIESIFSEPLIVNAYTPNGITAYPHTLNGITAYADTPNGTIVKRDSLELLKETYVDK
jgi:hypothetical protein